MGSSSQTQLPHRPIYFVICDEIQRLNIDSGHGDYDIAMSNTRAIKSLCTIMEAVSIPQEDREGVVNILERIAEDTGFYEKIGGGPGSPREYLEATISRILF